MIIRKDRPELGPSRIPTDLEVAWAAGIYEGEGSCVQQGHGKRSFAVSLSQKDPEFLYRLRDLFGGTVKEYKNDRGTNVSPGVPLTIYAWRVCGDRGRMFLALIYPYLTARRRAQINATTVRFFLDEIGTIPTPTSDCLSYQYLAVKLQEFVAAHLQEREERNKNRGGDWYKAHSSDPVWMEKRRNQTREWREKKKQKIVSIA